MKELVEIIKNKKEKNLDREIHLLQITDLGRIKNLLYQEILDEAKRIEIRDESIASSVMEKLGLGWGLGSTGQGIKTPNDKLEKLRHRIALLAEASEEGVVTWQDTEKLRVYDKVLREIDKLMGEDKKYIFDKEKKDVLVDSIIKDIQNVKDVFNENSIEAFNLRGKLAQAEIILASCK